MRTKRTRTPEYDEGPEATRRFDSAMRQIVQVSREELARREAEYQKLRSTKPHRGPAKKSR